MHMEMWFGRNNYFSIYLLSRIIDISFNSHCVAKLYIFNGEKRNAVGSICSFLDIWFPCIVRNPGLTDRCCSWAICVLGAIQRGEFLGCTFHQGILQKNHQEVKKWKQPCQTSTHFVHLKKKNKIFMTHLGVNILYFFNVYFKFSSLVMLKFTRKSWERISSPVQRKGQEGFMLWQRLLMSLYRNNTWKDKQNNHDLTMW